MRSIVSSGYGRRPRPALGYAGSIRSSNADHGVTCSISARNFSRLVRLRLPAYSASPKVICVIDGSRVGCRSEEHTSELQSLMRISYAVFCLKKQNKETTNDTLKLTS